MQQCKVSISIPNVQHSSCSININQHTLFSVEQNRLGHTSGNIPTISHFEIRKFPRTKNKCLLSKSLNKCWVQCILNDLHLIRSWNFYIQWLRRISQSFQRNWKVIRKELGVKLTSDFSMVKPKFGWQRRILFNPLKENHYQKERWLLLLFQKANFNTKKEITCLCKIPIKS